MNTGVVQYNDMYKNITGDKLSIRTAKYRNRMSSTSKYITYFSQKL